MDSTLLADARAYVLAPTRPERQAILRRMVERHGSLAVDAAIPVARERLMLGKPAFDA